MQQVWLVLHLLLCRIIPLPFLFSVNSKLKTNNYKLLFNALSAPLSGSRFSLCWGISADPFFSQNLRVPMRSFAIAAMDSHGGRWAVALRDSQPFSERILSPLGLCASVPHGFALPPFLFVIFGMWASKAAARKNKIRVSRHYLN